MFGFPDITQHGSLGGLDADDHVQYLLIDGTRAMTGALQTADAGGVLGVGGLTTSGNFTQFIGSGRVNETSAIGVMFNSNVAGAAGSKAFTFTNGAAFNERFTIKKLGVWGTYTPGHAAVGELVDISSEVILNVGGAVNLGVGLGASAAGLAFSAVTTGSGTFQTPSGAKFNLVVQNSGLIPLPTAMQSILIHDGPTSWSTTPGQATPAAILCQLRSNNGSASFGGEADSLQVTRPLFNGGVPIHTVGVDIFGQGTNTAQDRCTGLISRNQSQESAVGIPTATGILIEKQTGHTNNYGLVMDGAGAGSQIVFGATKDFELLYDGIDAVYRILTTGVHSFTGGNVSVSAIDIETDTVTGTKIGTAASQKLGFWNAAPIVQPAVTGSRAGNAALTSLLSQLAAAGLVVDNTIA